jgi:hypothetical protein
MKRTFSFHTTLKAKLCLGRVVWYGL